MSLLPLEGAVLRLRFVVQVSSMKVKSIFIIILNIYKQHANKLIWQP